MLGNRHLLLIAIRNEPSGFRTLIDLLVVSQSPRSHEHDVLEDREVPVLHPDALCCAPKYAKKPVGRTSDQRVSQKRLFG